jgi:hypothetical protein
MERGAGGGVGERALEQVLKQHVSGDARFVEQEFEGARIPGTEGEGWPETGHRTAQIHA